MMKLAEFMNLDDDMDDENEDGGRDYDDEIISWFSNLYFFIESFL